MIETTAAAAGGAETAVGAIVGLCVYVLACALRGLLLGHDPGKASTWSPWYWKRVRTPWEQAQEERELDRIVTDGRRALHRYELEDAMRRVADGERDGTAASLRREWRRAQAGYRTRAERARRTMRNDRKS